MTTLRQVTQQWLVYFFGLYRAYMGSTALW